MRLEELRRFLEHEAELLDERRFDEWCDLYTEDATYWVPASPEQENWRDHVSLFYDDKHTMRTRIQRLNHPRIHCQSPPSRCVRVISGVRLDEVTAEGAWLVRSKFVMVEDRPGNPQRVFGGRYSHTIVQVERSAAHPSQASRPHELRSELPDAHAAVLTRARKAAWFGPGPNSLLLVPMRMHRL